MKILREIECKGEKKVDEGVLFFKELMNKKELTEYFALRYREFKASGLHVTQSADELDIDHFDFYSRFIGAFLIEKGEESLIGGIRMIYKDREGPSAPIIREICSESLDLKKLSRSNKPRIFQLMNEVDIVWLIKECEESGKALVEFGRTIVDKRYRRRGVGGMLVNAIFNFALQDGVDVGFGGCPENLLAFYERDNCRPVGKFYSAVHGMMLILLRIDFPLNRKEGREPEKVLVAVG